jgi:osmotically-inducible protein OsmY
MSASVSAVEPVRPRRATLAIPPLVLGLFACVSVSMSAPEPKTQGAIGEVVVTAKKLPVPDEELTRRVEEALQADPYIFTEHVTVRTQNGVVHVEGLIYNYTDLIDLKQIARKIRGAKRVVLDVEMIGGTDTS